jgi:hypothetical protein
VTIDHGDERQLIQWPDIHRTEWHGTTLRLVTAGAELFELNMAENSERSREWLAAFIDGEGHRSLAREEATPESEEAKAFAEAMRGRLDKQ